MKKNLKLLLVLIVLFVTGFTCLIKTYNPTTYGWQTDLVTHLAKLTDIFYLPSWLFKPHSLPVYKITINPDNYIFLNQNLPDPSKTDGILPDKYKKYVPAKFSYNGQEYDVQVRYRGFDFDHWTRDKKSWRVKFDQDQPFQGQTAINLVIPEDRGLYLEELSNFRAKKLGLTVPPSKFINLKVNGKTQGVYWQFEHWNLSFLEKHQFPPGNLYGEVNQQVKRSAQKPIYNSLEFWRKYVRDEIYQEDNYAEIALLLDLLNKADDQEFFQKLPHLLDIDNFLSWQAHSVLMGSTHQDELHNIRLYWHPALGKFIIFPWDVLGGKGWPIDYHPLVSRVLSNPNWLKQRNQILSNYVNDANNLTDDLNYYDQLVAQTKTAIFQDYLKFFSNYGYLQQTNKFRQQLIDQVQLIEQLLKDNNLPDETSGFNLPDQNLLKLAVTDKTVDQEGFKDFEKLFLSPQKLTYSGVNYINSNIIIPSGYQVKLLPGTRLIFGENVSFVSYSPVQAQAAILTAQNQDKPWGVFAVMGKNANQSNFNQITVEYGSEAVINGTLFTGALAIHDAGKVTVNGSLFRFNHGDDGLNIKYTDAIVTSNQFIENDYDGFDLDFGNGQILNNTFLKNGNDGLDLGSASPLIKDNLFNQNTDKCISLGETSSPRIINNIIKNCNYGLAVKDSSQPEITQNKITNNHIGLGSYLKKPIFPRLPFIFDNNHMSHNQIDFEEQDQSLRLLKP